ncbi:twin-arginine translocation signal domain-containing protein, partial [bacterium]|nr:twin-arginine translocation signal domain-containing protein [bacterium]
MTRKRPAPPRVLTRRDFLKLSAASAGALGLFNPLA